LPNEASVPNTSSLPAGSNRPRPCQGLGNKQHRVPALPKRHRWDGWYGWEVVPFSRPCWCIRRPGDEGRVWLAPEGSENIPTRARTGQKWPANFLDFFFWRRPFCGIFWEGRGKRAQAPCRWVNLEMEKVVCSQAGYTLVRGSAVPARRGPKPSPEQKVLPAVLCAPSIQIPRVILA
jgi:hypothetical protein